MKNKNEVVALLGKGTEFEGKLKFHGTIRIDGQFSGEIGGIGTLIVGEEATVHSDIHISHIVINGEVRGNITADQKIEIHPPAKVYGNIQAPSVMIDEGVMFEGQTQMFRPANDADLKLLPVRSDSHTRGTPPNLPCIFGVVLDKESSRPIEGAKVKFKGSAKKTTRTNAMGCYSLPAPKKGTWDLTINAKGYRKQTMAVEVSAEGGIHEKNIDLEPRKKQ